MSMDHSHAMAAAEHALLTESRPLERTELLALAGTPEASLMELIGLAHRVRLAHRGPAVSLESILSAKSGACTEDCGFCSQSAHFKTAVDAHPFLATELVVECARRAEQAGAAEFCIVVSGRGPDARLLSRVVDVVRAVRAETSLEVACSLGLLTPDDAAALVEAGVRRYNHNLETSRAFFPNVCTTHTYDDRLATARVAREAGMELCCGGILGLGETVEDRVDLALELAELAPDEVPVNFLDPRPGTPMAGRPLLSPEAALQILALFRLALPGSAIRLGGGREKVLGHLQSLGLLAGADALIVGNYLTTTGRPAADDLALLESLGMPVAAPSARAYVVERLDEGA